MRNAIPSAAAKKKKKKLRTNQEADFYNGEEKKDER